MKKYLQYVCTVLIIIAFGLLYSCERQKDVVEIIDSDDVVSEKEITTTVLQETITMICVHVTGYVQNPGIYNVPVGSRVYEVIELAGGFCDEADRDYLNQAAVLSDGQKLCVYSKDEVATASQSLLSDNSNVNDTRLVNINIASKEELMTLPGIGESRAESIIAYREENGGFKAIEDIMKVSGIKDAAFSKIKNYICTN